MIKAMKCTQLVLNKMYIKECLASYLDHRGEPKSFCTNMSHCISTILSRISV